ncbi:MAG: hypothetical protein IKZ55_06540 [Bacteroidales bacterium]|nr:hypothetical protein [Bacteroidales bacterium]
MNGKIARQELLMAGDWLLPYRELLYKYTRYIPFIFAAPLTIDDLLWFCRHYIYNKEKLQVDGTYTNLAPATMPPYNFFKPSDLYK